MVGKDFNVLFYSKYTTYISYVTLGLSSHKIVVIVDSQFNSSIRVWVCESCDVWIVKS